MLCPPRVVFPLEVLMSDRAPKSAEGSCLGPSTLHRLTVPVVVDVVREGRFEPFLDAAPTKSSAPVHWGGIALENYTVPAVFIPRHQHPEHFLHVVLSGAVKPAAADRCIRR